jgi:hypothetical protein
MVPLRFFDNPTNSFWKQQNKHSASLSLSLTHLRSAESSELCLPNKDSKKTPTTKTKATGKTGSTKTTGHAIDHSLVIKDSM